MSEERILHLENAMATLAELSAGQEQRVVRLEESFVTLVDLLRSHQDGITELRAAQAHSDTKLAALADAQIRAEVAREHLQASLKQLAESQAHSDRKLEALIDIVRGNRNGRSES